MAYISFLLVRLYEQVLVASFSYVTAATALSPHKFDSCLIMLNRNDEVILCPSGT